MLYYSLILFLAFLIVTFSSFIVVQLNFSAVTRDIIATGHKDQVLSRYVTLPHVFLLETFKMYNSKLIPVACLRIVIDKVDNSHRFSVPISANVILSYSRSSHLKHFS